MLCILNRSTVLSSLVAWTLWSSPAATPAQTLELVADDLPNIVSFTFDPDGRIFFTEKNSGRVRLIVDGVLQEQPVTNLFVTVENESGMTGIALHPDFAENHFFYVHFTVGEPGVSCPETENVVLRFTEVDGVGEDPQRIFSSPQLGDCRHSANNIHFGPDGKLYVSLGDDDNPSNSQDLTARQGKIHRINPDGTTPADNPLVGQPGVEESIYAWGFRNSFDFDWDPLSGTLFASENGPFCDDEVNRVLPGHSYGWRYAPVQLCDDGNAIFNTMAPLHKWGNTVGPTGLHFYVGDEFPQLTNSLLVCNVNFGQLHVLTLDSGRTRVTNARVLPMPDGVRCDLDLQTGPDGALYFVEGGGFSVGRIWRVTD